MKKIILTLACIFFLIFISFGQEIGWQKTFGGTSSDLPACMVELNDGTFIIVNSSNSNDHDVSNNYGDMDLWIFKMDATGNIFWEKNFGGSAWDYANKILKMPNGTLLVIGGTQSIDFDVTNNHGNGDGWIINIDTAGTLLWQKCYGGTNSDYFHSAEFTSDGNIILVGNSSSVDGDIIDTANSGDILVMKIDLNGNILWQKCFGGSNTEDAYNIISNADNTFVISGISNSNDLDVSGNHGQKDFWIIKIDSIGNLIWQKSFGGSDDEYFDLMDKTTDGNYLIAGTTLSTDGDISNNNGASDIWVIKIDSSGSLIWEKCYGFSYGEMLRGIESLPNGNVLLSSESLFNSITNTYIGNWDIWIIEIDSIGGIIRQKYMGGSKGDEAMGGTFLAASGDVFVLGATDSHDRDVSFCYSQCSGCPDSWLVKLTDNYNSINGKLFIDTNSNGLQDSGEVSLNHNPVYEINTGKFSFSQSTGDYHLTILDTGSFMVTSPLNYYSQFPAFHSVNFSAFHQTDSLNDFAFQPLGVFNDLCAYLTPMGSFRANMNASYMITYQNVGTTTLNGTVIFFPDTNLTFVSSNVIATSVTTDSIVWNVGTLTPFQVGTILVTIHVNAGTPIGTFINSNVRIDPFAGDANTTCNVDDWGVFVTGSNDPNGIFVDRDTVSTTELSSPPYLNYIVYFQNTGTASCLNARVLNNIPQKLDINSFEFVASSHPVNIDYSAASRLFTFNFNNINLPDSGANEPASHGFIRYQIRPLSTLVAGDSIKNNAAIYFDFNQPVMTDTAITEIVLPTGLQIFNIQSSIFNLSPNPANGLVKLNFLLEKNADVKIEVFSSFGQIIKTVSNGKLNSGKQQIDFDAGNFSDGIYFVKMVVDGQLTVRKLIKM